MTRRVLAAVLHGRARWGFCTMPDVRVLPHIKRLDDRFGDFLVHVVCECGACREIQPWRAWSAGK